MHKNAFKRGKKIFTILLASLYLFANTASAKDTLSPETRLPRKAFREIYKFGYTRLHHKAVNAHITAEIDKAGGIENMQKKTDSVDIKNVKIDLSPLGVDRKDIVDGIHGFFIVLVPELLKTTGQIVHGGLGTYNGIPTIYVDSLYKNYDSVRLHEATELALWRRLQAYLSLHNIIDEDSPKALREWMKNNIKIAREFAEQFHNTAPPVDPDLYTKAEQALRPEMNDPLSKIYEMYLKYGFDENSDDINIAGSWLWQFLTAKRSFNLLPVSLRKMRKLLQAALDEIDFYNQTREDAMNRDVIAEYTTLAEKGMLFKSDTTQELAARTALNLIDYHTKLYLKKPSEKNFEALTASLVPDLSNSEDEPVILENMIEIIKTHWALKYIKLTGALKDLRSALLSPHGTGLMITEKALHAIAKYMTEHSKDIIPSIENFFLTTEEKELIFLTHFLYDNFRDPGQKLSFEIPNLPESLLDLCRKGSDLDKIADEVAAMFPNLASDRDETKLILNSNGHNLKKIYSNTSHIKLVTRYKLVEKLRKIDGITKPLEEKMIPLRNGQKLPLDIENIWESNEVFVESLGSADPEINEIAFYAVVDLLRFHYEMYNTVIHWFEEDTSYSVMLNNITDVFRLSGDKDSKPLILDGLVSAAEKNHKLMTKRAAAVFSDFKRLMLDHNKKHPRLHLKEFNQLLAIAEKAAEEAAEKAQDLPSAPEKKRTPSNTEGSPKGLLNVLKNNEGLLKKMIRGTGVSVREMVPYRIYRNPGKHFNERTVRKEFETLKALEIFVPSGTEDHYRFSEMMVSPGEIDLEYTRTLINAVKDVKLKVGTHRENRALPLHRYDIPDDKIPDVRTLVKMMALNERRKRMPPEASPENKILWHIIDRDILSAAQRTSGFVQNINKAFKGSDAPERVRILRTHESVESAISDIQKKHKNVTFDVALSSYRKMYLVPDEYKALVFEGEMVDVVQLEGILEALSALHLHEDQAKAHLLSLYKILTGKSFDADKLTSEVLDDPRKLAKLMIFTLPKPKELISNISELNFRLEKFITTKA